MHTCPDCGQACSCAGDIEDHDTGDEFYEACEHCECVDFGDDDEIDEQIWEPGGGSYTTRMPKKTGTAPPELQAVLAEALKGDRPPEADGE